jgi:hypothetical protein
MPVTTPLLTVAFVLPALQTPPAAGSDKLIDVPIQTLSGPLMTPASGNALTNIAAVVDTVPQPDDTV